MIYLQNKAALRTLAPLLVFALGTKAAFAVGLGPLQLHSGIGQQLRANVPLLAVNVDAIDSSCIKATVESADGAYLTTPQIGLISKGAPPAIVLSSKQAIMEPALTLRISLSCGSSISRDYQILLDPPQYDIGSNSEQLTATSMKPQATPATSAASMASSTEMSPPAAMSPAARRSSPLPRAPKKIKPEATAPKATATQSPNTVRPQRSVLKITTAEVGATPILKQAPASTPAAASTTSPMPGLAAPAAASSTATQPDLQMYALQAQMKDQMQALQKEMAAIRQQNQVDKIKLEELRKTGVSPQVMQGMIGLLALCLGAIGWLGWRLYSLKNNHHLE
jgi:pilus assembly protein FimV